MCLKNTDSFLIRDALCFTGSAATAIKRSDALKHISPFGDFVPSALDYACAEDEKNDDEQ